MDPTIARSDIHVNVATSGTSLLVILKNSWLTQDNTDFKNHSGYYLVGEFRRIDTLAVFSMYHHIVTPLDVSVPNASFTVAIDDIVKVLACLQV